MIVGLQVQFLSLKTPSVIGTLISSSSYNSSLGIKIERSQKGTRRQLVCHYLKRDGLAREGLHEDLHLGTCKTDNDTIRAAS